MIPTSQESAGSLPDIQEIKNQFPKLNFRQEADIRQVLSLHNRVWQIDPRLMHKEFSIFFGKAIDNGYKHVGKSHTLPMIEIFKIGELKSLCLHRQELDFFYDLVPSYVHEVLTSVPTIRVINAKNYPVRFSELPWSLLSLDLSVEREDFRPCAGVMDRIEQMADLSKLPRGLKNLRLCGLENFKIKPNDLPPGLLALDLTDCTSLKDEDIANLPRGIKQVNLTNCAITPEALKNLPPTVEELDLYRCGYINFESLAACGPIELPLSIKRVYLPNGIWIQNPANVEPKKRQGFWTANVPPGQKSS